MACLLATVCTAQTAPIQHPPHTVSVQITAFLTSVMEWMCIVQRTYEKGPMVLLSDFAILCVSTEKKQFQQVSLLLIFGNSRWHVWLRICIAQILKVKFLSWWCWWKAKCRKLQMCCWGVCSMDSFVLNWNRNHGRPNHMSIYIIRLMCSEYSSCR